MGSLEDFDIAALLQKSSHSSTDSRRTRPRPPRA